MAAAGVVTQFELPTRLEATEPPEARGLRRDEVRLMVSNVSADSIEHAHFYDLGRWLSAGDLLVVNTSGTLKAALSATTSTRSGRVHERSGRVHERSGRVHDTSATTAPGNPVELHVSSRLPGNFWTIEVRRVQNDGASLPEPDASAGMIFHLPEGGTVTLLAPYPLVDSAARSSRLWIAVVALPMPVVEFLDTYGFPIRYRYVTKAWPSDMYQTVFANEPGSAEMPSAGRPFSAELVTRLVARGVQFAPLVLHTGVSSQEKHEPPYEEFYRVPRDTADRVNAARRAGHRVIAVGTTVVRALETVTDERGDAFPGEGWTDLVITPDRALRSVSGLITGLHEPQATHLTILERAVEAAAGLRPGSSVAKRHLQRAYEEALRHDYLWHEFGDSHLILGSRA